MTISPAAVRRAAATASDRGGAGRDPAVVRRSQAEEEASERERLERAVHHFAICRVEGIIMDDGRSQEEYVRRVLEAYRKTPGTMGTVRRPDRVLVAQLYQRGVSVSVIENALRIPTM